MGIRRMSIQEGLNELKNLDARIERALSIHNPYGAIVVGQRPVNGFESNEKYIEGTKSIFNSAKSLIKRRAQIKNAIIKKNAEVVVSIGDKKMTLAEAINQKTYITADKRLLAGMINQYTQLMRQMDQFEASYRQKLDLHVEQIVGKEQKDKMKANEEIIKFFKQENEPKFIDPIGLKESIEKMSQEIEEFEAKVDFVLTRANITNDIEFDDPTVGGHHE